jgi:hypothetical protein
MKALLFTAFLFLFITSCKKNSSVAPVNTLSATINGVSESFNINLLAQNSIGSTLHSDLSVFGSNGKSVDSSDALSITVDNNSAITVGTYTNTSNSNEGFVRITYYKSPASFIDPNTYTSDVNGTYLTTIKITSISSTNVQGTFSAQLVYFDGKTINQVTNGKFNVNLN